MEEKANSLLSTVRGFHRLSQAIFSKEIESVYEIKTIDFNLLDDAMKTAFLVGRGQLMPERFSGQILTEPSELRADWTLIATFDLLDNSIAENFRDDLSEILLSSEAVPSQLIEVQKELNFLISEILSGPDQSIISQNWFVHLHISQLALETYYEPYDELFGFEEILFRLHNSPLMEIWNSSTNEAYNFFDILEEGLSPYYDQNRKNQEIWKSFVEGWLLSGKWMQGFLGWSLNWDWDHDVSFEENALQCLQFYYSENGWDDMGQLLELFDWNNWKSNYPNAGWNPLIDTLFGELTIMNWCKDNDNPINGTKLESFLLDMKDPPHD